MPSTGYTHLNIAKDGSVTWSTYRLHIMDLLTFTEGIRLGWRNGDTAAPDSGGENKCITESGGVVVGSPQISIVTSYSWTYVW